MRTQLERTIVRAGLTPWPRLCTELKEQPRGLSMDGNPVKTARRHVRLD